MPSTAEHAGDVSTIAATRAFYAQLAASCQADVGQIELALANLAVLELDAATIAGLQSVQDDARRAAERCARLLEVLDVTHRLMEDAVTATPEAAKREFYQHGAAGVRAREGDTVTRPAALPPQEPVRQLAVLQDPLRIADRIQLAPGEQVTGSGAIGDGDGLLLLAAGGATPDGPRVRLGVGILDEDRLRWRGADVGATVVLDAAGAERLADAVEQVIEQAAAADAEFRRICKADDRLTAQCAALEERRFPGRAEEKMQLDTKLRYDSKTQQDRGRYLDAAIDRLGPSDRAAYDSLQERIAALDHAERWPLREQQAAIICGLTLDEYRERRALEGEFGFRRRTPAEQARLDEL